MRLNPGMNRILAPPKPHKQLRSLNMRTETNKLHHRYMVLDEIRTNEAGPGKPLKDIGL